VLLPRRDALAALGSLLVGAAGLSSAACAAPRATDGSALNRSGQNDFDFLIGDWHVSHRRLRERLAGNNDWTEFDGTCSMRTLLGGLGNVDDNLLNLPAGPYRGVGLRAFDASSGRWAIWWLDSRTPHIIEAPVVGGFEAGVGTFQADDTFKGRPIRVRFRWTDTLTVSPGWEQAFSPDSGKTWETNWTMRFVRRPAA
jgi:hypothetical protein